MAHSSNGLTRSRRSEQFEQLVALSLWRNLRQVRSGLAQMALSVRLDGQAQLNGLPEGPQNPNRVSLQGCGRGGSESLIN
jgi:hypothetical protein